MKKKCEYCGKELKEGADVCLHCGKLVKKEKEVEVPKEIKKDKIPGNGKSIAGMILGIFACAWVFFEILSLPTVNILLRNILFYNYYSNAGAIKICFAIYFTFLSLVPSLVGLPLSIFGYNKMKTGKNVAGLILNTIALSISLIIYIYIMLFI